MTDGSNAGTSHSPERCDDCGRFAPVVYEWRGPAYVEVTDCDCGGAA